MNSQVYPLPQRSETDLSLTGRGDMDFSLATREPAPLEYYAHLIKGRQQLYAEYDLPVPATDCRHCLTQSCEGDLAVLDPARYAIGAAALPNWDRHPVAHVYH